MKKSIISIGLALCAGTAVNAQTSLKACPFTPQDLEKALGTAFKPGVEEPGIGGKSCKYVTGDDAVKSGKNYVFYVFQLAAGSDQAMVRKMVLGPNAKLEAIKADPDQAERAVNADGMLDIAYKRKSAAVILRVSFGAHEPDAKARAQRASQMESKLLKLPRLGD